MTVVAVVMVVFPPAAVAGGGARLMTPILSFNWRDQFDVDLTRYLVLSGICMA